LITRNFHGLIPTISSRVQRVNFQPLSQAEMSEGLQEFNLSSKQGLEILDLAHGRLGFARELAGSQELLEFYRLANVQYETLEKGKAEERLLISQDLSSLEIEQIRQFLVFSMGKWFMSEGSSVLGAKLNQAYQDLDRNLNTKLVLDNLFL